MSLPTNYKSSGGFDTNNQKVINLADATNPQDALNLRTFDAKNTVTPYVQTKTYNPDFIVEYAGQLWKCIGVTSGLFDKTKWTAIRGTENWIRITGLYTAAPMDSLIVDTYSVPLSIILPATPKSGDYVHIIDAGNADVNNITVIRNGSTIGGVDSNLILNESGIQLTLVYLGGTWMINIDKVNRVKFISGSATVESNTVYAMLVSSSFNVTLPQAPRTGDWVSLIDRNGSVGSNTITVLGGIKQIEGQTSFSITQKKSAWQFIYNGTAWVTFMLTGNSLQADKNLSDVENKVLARSNLGLGSVATFDQGTASGQIRTNTQNDLVYQPLDQTLTALAGLVVSANKLIYATGVDQFATTDFPDVARNFLATNTSQAQRDILGLGTASTRNVGTASGNLIESGNAFGWGPMVTQALLTNIDTTLDSGVYAVRHGYTTSGVLPLSLPDNSGATLLVTAYRSIVGDPNNFVEQRLIYTKIGTPKIRIFVRRYGQGVWESWEEALTTANTGTAVQRNVGTGPNDLIEVKNSFGLGTSVVTYVGNIDDATAIPRGWVGVDATNGTTGTLPYSNGILQTVGSIVGGGIRQVFHQITGSGSPRTNLSYVRDQYGVGNWGPWKTVAYRDDLGTASTRNVGTASSNLLEVGAFGIGGDGSVIIPNLDDATLKTGIYSVDATTTGTKPTSFTGAAIVNATVIVTRPNTSLTTQILLNGAGVFSFTRGYSSGVWSAWIEINTQLNMFPAWTTVTYSSGWVDADPAYNGAGYRKEGNRVWLRGFVKNPTTGSSAIFTLPTGFRPLKNKYLIAMINGSVATYISITPSGVVTIGAYTSANTNVTLDNLSFEID